jgi:transcriptional regulator with XRE-family HTH domain
MDMTNDRSPLSAAFAEQMRAERAASRLSQSGLAKRSGISLSTIKRLESNEREMDTDQLDRLCRSFGLTITEFVVRAEARRGDEAEHGHDLRDVSGK